VVSRRIKGAENMTLVEQAVFTSAETDRLAGYQVVSKSPGVCTADCRELAVWCPSHDSLLDLGAESPSLNFHPLPSGAYCISRTTPAGWEYSGRGGVRVYTHCLIVPPTVLSRFSNNPFALARAAEASGAMKVLAQPPKRLEPLPLVGGAAAVDQTLLAQLAGCPGPQRLTALVQAALDCVCLAVAGPVPAGQLMAGLLSCLPPQCRTEFSFSTGLKFSSRRPFRLVALPGDPAQRRWVAHQNNVSVLDLADGAPAAATPIEGWAQLIGRVLACGRTSFLSTQLSRCRGELRLAELSAWGLQLLEDLDASAPFEQQQDATSSRGPGSDQPGSDQPSGNQPPPRPPGRDQRAHAAHRRFQKSGDPAAAAELSAAGPAIVPPQRDLSGPIQGRPQGREKPPTRGDAPLPNAKESLDPASRAVLERLEYLDDVVYQAVNGQATALEELETLWPATLAELGEDLVAESREQYLRYALTIWDGCLEPGAIRDPSRAVQALDVLCVLFNEV
jgi:hypothetical protein